ncbi:MAG: AraC family transcriptional regulator [Clostridiales bacterium]|nr:AraC family transcriptional regulator [Clostridiales bacterium]
MSHEHYYPKSELLPMAPRLLYTGCVKNDPDWFNTPHAHDFCEILYVADGKGEIVIDGRRYSLTTGDLIVVNPGLSHAERSDPQSPLHLIFLGVDGLEIDGMGRNQLIHAEHSPIIQPNKYRYKLESYFSDLIAETLNQVEYYSEISHGLVTALVVLILRILHVSGQPSDGGMSEECRKIKAYIDTHYTSDITLESLSEAAYISKHHLAHIFKQQAGVSPIRYLIERRIERAKSLLAETDMPIQEVAGMVGYADNVYFSQIFKRITGQSPSAFRRAHKG